MSETILRVVSIGLAAFGFIPLALGLAGIDNIREDRMADTVDKLVVAGLFATTALLWSAALAVESAM